MTETYHIYGFGVDLSQLGNVSLDRLEQLIGMAPVLESKILKWFKEENINKPKLEDYYEVDEENLGLPTLLKEVIFELEGVDLTACEDLNNRTYLLYESRYPWNMRPVDCFMTPERLLSLYRKYIKIISDSDYDIECHSVEGTC